MCQRRALVHRTRYFLECIPSARRQQQHLLSLRRRLRSRTGNGVSKPGAYAYRSLVYRHPINHWSCGARPPRRGRPTTAPPTAFHGSPPASPRTGSWYRRGRVGRLCRRIESNPDGRVVVHVVGAAQRSLFFDNVTPPASEVAASNDTTRLAESLYRFTVTFSRGLYCSRDLHVKIVNIYIVYTVIVSHKYSKWNK